MSKAPKHKGQVFTPDYLVKNILDLCGYTETPAIIDKHIIDNSCGDGAFLVEVAQRFIGAYRLAGYSDDAIKQALETYVHGIELDTDAYTKCIENLTTLSETFNLTGVKWNITNTDALTNTRYLASMDCSR